MPNQDAILQAFEAFTRQASSKDPSWLLSLRKEALSHFIQEGFPTTKKEDWKYTSVEPIAKSSFEFSFEPSANGLASRELEPFFFQGLKENRIVFVNNFYSETLSTFSQAEGVEVGSLKKALTEWPKEIEKHLAQYADFKTSAFTAFNTAFVQDGVFVSIPKGRVVEAPIHLLFIEKGSSLYFPRKSVESRDLTPIAQPRILILAGEGAHATVIESYVSLSDGIYFTNAVTEIALAPAARIDHYKIQRESEKAFHVATTQVSVVRDSAFSSFSLSVGGALSRSDLNVLLKDEGANCVLNGLYLTRDRQHTDHHTLIDHTKPHGTSRQLYKGVLRDHSRAVFNGKIFVRQDAQKTDAHQTNKNLLLSQGATADTKPQLEIFADDVKCTHGAAVGELEEEMIFYAKSRGFGEEAARTLLTYGFVNEVIQKISEEALRSSLDRLVCERLAQNQIEVNPQ